MSARLPTLSRRRVIKALTKAGFVLDRSRGKGGHARLRRPSDGRVTHISSGDGKDVRPGTLRDILSQAGLTREEFLALL